MNERKELRYRIRAVLEFVEKYALWLLLTVTGILTVFGVIFSFTVGITVVLAFVVSLLVLQVLIIPSLRKKVGGKEEMLGSQGRVVESLKPVGTVMVRGEHWRAVSAKDEIEVDETVKVVGVEGLTLKVVQLRGKIKQ